MNRKDKTKLKIELENKIKIFSKENADLIHKVNDYKQTLGLNFELLQKIFLKYGKNNEEEIIKHINKGKNIFNKYDNLLIKRKKIEHNINILKKNIEKNNDIIYNKIEDYSKNIELITKEIKFQDNDIIKLKEDLQKLRDKAFFKKPGIEIKVCEPSQIIILKNQEIINAKYILEKAINIQLNKEENLKEIKSKYKLLYNKLIYEFKNKKIDNNYIKQFELEEEDNNNKESSSGEEELEDKKKEKQKTIDNLKEKFQNLKIKYNSYKKQIDLYKQRYRYYKREIKLIKINIQKNKFK